uniref:Uncharacterized protein n=1 Tax=Schizaphis graminum TaxID=13262 RepID=A0A2S2PV64_SCHGA
MCHRSSVFYDCYFVEPSQQRTRQLKPVNDLGVFEIQAKYTYTKAKYGEKTRNDIIILYRLIYLANDIATTTTVLVRVTDKSYRYAKSGVSEIKANLSLPAVPSRIKLRRYGPATRAIIRARTFFVLKLFEWFAQCRPLSAILRVDTSDLSDLKPS